MKCITHTSVTGELLYYCKKTVSTFKEVQLIQLLLAKITAVSLSPTVTWPRCLLYATEAISANCVCELHNCSNRESVHCLDVYTRSLFMSIVHRPSATVSF